MYQAILLSCCGLTNTYCLGTNSLQKRTFTIRFNDFRFTKRRIKLNFLYLSCRKVLFSNWCGRLLGCLQYGMVRFKHQNSEYHTSSLC